MFHSWQAPCFFVTGASQLSGWTPGLTETAINVPFPLIILACCVRKQNASLLPPLQVCASPDGIPEAVLSFDASVLQPFVKGSAAGIVSRLDALMGFQ